MSTYFDNLISAMSLLAEQPNSIFVGQAVKYEGTSLYHTLKHLPEEKRLEMPVAENMQLGMSIGLSLQGYLPVSIFPRYNFLLSATDQLVNHLDKLSEMSQGEYNPKVIIRTSIGSEKPLWPGKQHTGDFSEAFDMMLENIPVIRLDNAEMIVPEYQKATERKGSTILVEYADKYNE